MSEEQIERAVRHILQTLPAGVMLVAASKSRSAEEVRAAIRAGVTCVGHNYVQEAEAMVPLVPETVRWHLIGHLQRNKAKVAVLLFDMIETLDSWRLAVEIDKRCAAIDKVMPVLVEVNSGREASKTGVLPKDVDGLVRRRTRLHLPEYELHGRCLFQLRSKSALMGLGR